MKIAMLLAVIVLAVLLEIPATSGNACGCSSKKELEKRKCGEDDVTYYKRIFKVDSSSECSIKKFYESIFYEYKSESKEAYVQRIDIILNNVYTKLDCRFDTNRIDYVKKYYKYKYCKNNGENDEQFFNRILPKTNECDSVYKSKVEIMKKCVESVDWSKIKIEEKTKKGFSIVKKSTESCGCQEKKREQEEKKSKKEKEKSLDCDEKKKKERENELKQKSKTNEENKKKIEVAKKDHCNNKKEIERKEEEHGKNKKKVAEQQDEHCKNVKIGIAQEAEHKENVVEVERQRKEHDKNQVAADKQKNEHIKNEQKVEGQKAEHTENVKEIKEKEKIRKGNIAKAEAQEAEHNENVKEIEVKEKICKQNIAKAEAQEAEHNENVKEIEERENIRNENIAKAEAKNKAHEENVRKWIKNNYRKKNDEDINAYYKRICSKSGTNDEYIERLTIARSLFSDLELWYSEEYLSETKDYYTLAYSKKTTETEDEYYSRLVRKESYESDSNYAKRINVLHTIFPSLKLWYEDKYYERYTKTFYKTYYKKEETESNEVYLKRVFRKASGESEECFWKRIKKIKATFPDYKCWYEKDNLQKLDVCKSFSKAKNEDELKKKVETEQETEQCRKDKLECLQTFFKSSKSSQSSKSSSEEEEVSYTTAHA